MKYLMEEASPKSDVVGVILQDADGYTHDITFEQDDLSVQELRLKYAGRYSQGLKR